MNMINQSKIKKALIISLILITIFICTNTASAAWHAETVDSTGTVGRYTSLALDSNNQPNISYADLSNGDLKYAYYDGTTWHTQTVDSTEYVGYCTSLALDSNNHPHISYSDETNYDLKYAYYDGTTWHIETVDSTGNVGRYSSLALDSNNKPHISYHDDINGDLKYAYLDNTPPTVSSTDPANGATKVARNKTIKITFSEPITYGTKNIKLVSKSGTVIPITTSISGKVLTIKHTSLLATGTKYYIKLFTGCVTDLAGNNLAGISKSFTTTTDATKPTVKSTNPANGATKVARNKTVKIYFSEPVVKGTMNIKLVSSTGTEITIKKTISSTGTYMNLTHTALMKANTKYYVKIFTGSVTDKAGNPIAAKTISFTTGSS